MKRKTLRLFVLVSFIFMSCTKENYLDDSIEIDPNQKEPLSAKQINMEINKSIDVKGSFNWNDASNYLLWSGIRQGQNIATIGFGNSKTDFDRKKSPNNKKIESELLSLLQRYEGKELSKILIFSDPDLNLIDVVIEKQETVLALKKNNYLRYFEPADYRYLENKRIYEKSSVTSSGCGFDILDLDVSDYTVVTPNAKVPWSFYKHNIPSAWSYSTGRGITIGIIDSGVSPNQSLLGRDFNNGESSGRAIQKYGTYVDSIWPWNTTTDGPDDQCGHGTSMASVATAPRNNKGFPVGVAYNSNLIMYRASSDVVLEGYREHNGVKNAFTALANNNAVKIISMSMGHIISIGKIEDGIRYAYSKGKLIFCAGGTSTSFTNFVGVIFPAWMSETVAVTGVKDGTTFQKCDVCHSGGKIDFTVVMQKVSSGKTVPVNSYYDGKTDYVGGSSVATATTAGIAALVWAKNPGWSRDQVLAKMRQSANFYPNRNGYFGYGNINALLAVQ